MTTIATTIATKNELFGGNRIININKENYITSITGKQKVSACRQYYTSKTYIPPYVVRSLSHQNDTAPEDGDCITHLKSVNKAQIVSRCEEGASTPSTIPLTCTELSDVDSSQLPHVSSMIILPGKSSVEWLSKQYHCYRAERPRCDDRTMSTIMDRECNCPEFAVL